MKKTIFFLLLTALSLGFTACKTKEKLLYFNKGTMGSEVHSSYTPVFKTDDFLSIAVSGDDPEAVIPFNLPPTMQAGGLSGYSTGNPVLNGYLIDANGEITMPVLGQFKLVGLTRMEATQLIREKLMAYVKNPVVNIQIQNYKITVLGDVKNPGTYRIPNERITVLEAIGLAGDLRMTGDRKSVLVIRDENGTKSEYLLDLTTKEVFSSPAYYLTQNDVVYIQPNGTARSESTLWRTAGPIFISLTSLVVTTATLLFR